MVFAKRRCYLNVDLVGFWEILIYSAELSPRCSSEGVGKDDELLAWIVKDAMCLVI